MLESEIINIEETVKNLKEIRMLHNLSIQELSKKMHNTPVSLIKSIEQGEFIPTLNYVVDFCECFSISIDEIIVSKL